MGHDQGSRFLPFLTGGGGRSAGETPVGRSSSVPQAYWDFYRHQGGEGVAGGESGSSGAAPDPEKELAAAGSPLDGAVRERMEKRFGKDLSAVRVHSDEKAGQVTKAQGAVSFTYKNHIFFAPGAYRPGSPDGDALLAHELTHVVQTGGATGAAKGNAAVSGSDGAHEKEANRIGQTAYQDGGTAAPASGAGGGEIGPHLSGQARPSAGELGARLPTKRAGDEAATRLGQGPQPGYEVNETADPERSHQCIGGNSKPGMTMSAVTINVTQPAVSLSQRGSAEYKVKWSVGGGKNGWVVQHVRFEGTTKDSTGSATAPVNSGLEYWEAWEVHDGNVFVGFASGGSAHNADTFRTINEAEKTKGEVRIVGRVAFVDGYNLQTPPWGYTVAAAGSLPTMTGAPAGWSDGSAQDHWMKVEYDDIAKTPQTVTTSP